ncbi:hypothetical protein SK128_001564, partial [Halocaridina rubra]
MDGDGRRRVRAWGLRLNAHPNVLGSGFELPIVTSRLVHSASGLPQPEEYRKFSAK